MRGLEEFREFYRKKFYPLLCEIEKVRKEAASNSIKKILLTLSLFGALFCFLFLYSYKLEETPPWYYLLYAATTGGCVTVIHTIVNRNFATFRRRYDDEVIGGIVRFIEPKLKYSPAEFIPFKSFKASRLFEERVDRYTGCSLIHGLVGNTVISFSQVHAEREEVDEERDKDGNTQTRTYWVTVFRGTFFVADFNKHFNSQVILKPRNGRIVKNIFFRSSKDILLEDPEFNSLFKVYATDPVEARYILSTSLTRRLVELRRKLGCKLFVSFISPNVYIAIPYWIELEPSIYRSVLNYKRFENYFFSLKEIVDIVDSLNLNTRIWSKG